MFIPDGAVDSRCLVAQVGRSCEEVRDESEVLSCRDPLIGFAEDVMERDRKSDERRDFPAHFSISWRGAIDCDGWRRDIAAIASVGLPSTLSRRPPKSVKPLAVRSTPHDHRYNSWRNRHCPKCQGAAARAWLAEREAGLLPVPYFHVVFTLPAAIVDIAYQNKAAICDLLFKASAQTFSRPPPIRSAWAPRSQ
jgi:hypothetical protein